MIRRIEHLLQTNSITAYKMCKDLGIPHSTYSSWKAGKAQPSASTLKKIAGYFGVSLSWLMGDDATLTPVDPPENQRRIPILGRIPGGAPIAAITDIEGYIYYDPPRPTSAEIVALRVDGPSMEPEIRDGSIVIIRVSETCDPGDICAVSVNGDEACCKIVKPDAEGGVYLIPINPAFDPMHYTAKDIRDLPVRIIGVVEEVRYVPRKRA